MACVVCTALWSRGDHSNFSKENWKRIEWLVGWKFWNMRVLMLLEKSPSQNNAGNVCGEFTYRPGHLVVAPLQPGQNQSDQVPCSAFQTGTVVSSSWTTTGAKISIPTNRVSSCILVWRAVFSPKESFSSVWFHVFTVKQLRILLFLLWSEMGFIASMQFVWLARCDVFSLSLSCKVPRVYLNLSGSLTRKSLWIKPWCWRKSEIGWPRSDAVGIAAPVSGSCSPGDWPIDIINNS